MPTKTIELDSIIEGLSGSVCYGYTTDTVLEENHSTLIDWWSGTGSIENDENGHECILLDSGQYMECDPIYIGAIPVELYKDIYS